MDRRQFLERLGWVALVDVLLCELSVVINQVNPKERPGGMNINAEYAITAEWSVDLDADVDLHVIVPDGADGTDVYYNAREFHGVSLDHDCKGFVDDYYTMPNGDKVKNLTSKEMTTIRGKLPGRFDVGVHMFNFRRDGEPVGKSDRTLNTSVRVEVVKLNPKVHTMFSNDVVLTHVGQCINVVSFDLDKEGSFTQADLPLAPITDHVLKESTSG